jgi:hypothetical protein
VLVELWIDPFFGEGKEEKNDKVNKLILILIFLDASGFHFQLINFHLMYRQSTLASV